MAPNYNSRATKIAMVVQGCGDIEMACPHLSHESGEEEEREREWGREEERERGRERGHSRERGEEQGHSYSQVRSRACRGDVFVIPASHPVVAVASSNNNLQLLCFGIRAEDNRKIYLAGKPILSVIIFYLFYSKKEMTITTIDMTADLVPV